MYAAVIVLQRGLPGVSLMVRKYSLPFCEQRLVPLRNKYWHAKVPSALKHAPIPPNNEEEMILMFSQILAKFRFLQPPPTPSPLKI